MRRSQAFSTTMALLGVSVLSATLNAQGSHPASSDSLALTIPLNLTARSIGPAASGGRVSTIALDPKTPTTFYVGIGLGGIMKSTDGGTSFQAIFEHEKVASIGDIAIAPSDPQVLWVGSGEANDRNTEAWGDGVYRSTDQGRTWKHVGLSNSRAIARIAVHPTDPRTAYVAAVGDLWQSSAERGLYKTIDAGATWQKVLGAAAPNDTRVGAGEVALDPSNPNVVYAVLYARRRATWSFVSGPAASEGKDEGGIFKSEDAGATWHKLTNGLPTRTERIGLSVYARNPRIIYATVSASEAGGQGPTGVINARSVSGGVFRTDDGGAHWRRMSDLLQRPDYAGQIRVDPTNDRHVYYLSAGILVSEDSGKTWSEHLSRTVHPDNHALVIDPANPQHLIEGNDGGTYQSYSGGATWERLDRFVGGEFRSINVDKSVPYRVCGGLQDDGEWVGPSSVQNTIGIRNGDWSLAGMNDGAYCVFDSADSTLLYWSTNNALRRTDFRSGLIADLTPTAAGGRGGGGGDGGLAFNFNWTSPLIGSRHLAGVLYQAANVVIKLTDHADEWTVISPDLTRGGVQGGRAAISTLIDSPVRAGVLWAGTENGKVWRTADEGAHWTDLSENLPAAAKGHWMNRIEAGHADAGSAYLVVSAYREGNHAPLIYHTADSGRTWRDIAGNLPATEPARVVREDPDNSNVLYLGTEFGLWVTLDGGRSWARFGNLPTVAVEDILIEPRTHDIVIGTQGRSVWIIDQARPVAQVTRQILAGEMHLFAPEPAFMFHRAWQTFHEDIIGSVFRGQNSPDGAVLTYYVKHATEGGVSIAITTPAGMPVANLHGPATSGLNRVVWDFRPTADTRAGMQGTLRNDIVAPGMYVVTVTSGGAKSTQRLELRPVPGALTDYSKEWRMPTRP